MSKQSEKSNDEITRSINESSNSDDEVICGFAESELNVRPESDPCPKCKLSGGFYKEDELMMFAGFGGRNCTECGKLLPVNN